MAGPSFSRCTRTAIQSPGRTVPPSMGEAVMRRLEGAGEGEGSAARVAGGATSAGGEHRQAQQDHGHGSNPRGAGERATGAVSMRLRV